MKKRFSVMVNEQQGYIIIKAETKEQAIAKIEASGKTVKLIVELEV